MLSYEKLSYAFKLYSTTNFQAKLFTFPRICSSSAFNEIFYTVIDGRRPVLSIYNYSTSYFNYK